jgi:Tol biopolymer transport system component
MLVSGRWRLTDSAIEGVVMMRSSRVGPWHLRCPRPIFASFVFLTLAMAVLGLGRAASGGSYPGRSGKIAFVRGGDIWTVNSDGTSERRLIVHGDSPQWAPHGGRIAFQRDEDILVARADGTGVRVVVRGATDLGPLTGSPTWSPDGRRIAFAITEGIFDTNLFWVRVAEPHGRPQRLTTRSGTAYGPEWSPLGDEVLYGWISEGGSCASFFYELRIVSASTGAVRTVLNTGLAPVWAPDAQSIAFTSEAGLCDSDPRNLYRIGRDGSGRTKLTSLSDQGDVTASPTWSPNGQRLAYAQFTEAAGESDIYSIKQDGTGQRLVVRNGAEPDWQPLPPLAPAP